MQHVMEEIVRRGGVPFFVGGCVRDELLGITPKDFDVEVFGMTPDVLKEQLSELGRVDAVGESFGVLKFRDASGSEADFSIPRRDSKAGKGHRGFSVAVDPLMTVAEAAKRRDFTINAIYKHGVTGRLEDPLFGVTALRTKHLIVCDDATFADDPLRPLRGMQFAARFSLTPCPTTARLCQVLRPLYADLPKERVWMEWYKWATMSEKPSLGIRFLAATVWDLLYPEISAMADVPQNPAFHPEGCVCTHTSLVCDAAMDIAKRDGLEGEDRATLLFAALCHDMGKPKTTVWDRGAWRSPGHAEAGVPIAEQFLKSIGCFPRIIERVIPLVREHMYPHWEPQSRRAVRRLKVRLGNTNLDELLRIIEADYSGRPPLPAGLPDGAKKLRELDAELPPRIEPLVNGRHIMDAFGVKEGKEIGLLKNLAFEGQLNEEFATTEEGIAWLKTSHCTNPA